MIAVTNTLIVGDTTNGPLMAQRFKDEFDTRIREVHDALDDTPFDPVTVDSMMRTIAGGFDLRKFQVKVIETFDHYTLAMYDDELIQAFENGTEDPDMHDVVEIVNEFSSNNPGYSIQSIVPIDLRGTFGFVVIPKDMNP